MLLLVKISTLGIILGSISLFFLLDVLRTKSSTTPFFKYDDPNKGIKKYKIISVENLKAHIMLNYRISIEEVYKINNDKANSLNNALILLILGILISIISPLYILWDKVLYVI